MADETITVNLGAPARMLWPEGQQSTQAASLAISRLFRGGIVTIGQLTGTTEQDILEIRGAGDGTVNEIRRALAAVGLTLKDDNPSAAAREHARLRRLRNAGIGPSAARKFARETWPAGELAPGVTLTITERPGHV